MSVRDREDDGNDEDVEEYVPVHLRRLKRVKQFQQAKQEKASSAASSGASSSAGAAASASSAPSASNAVSSVPSDPVVAGPTAGKSLLDHAIALRESKAPMSAAESTTQKIQEEEKEVMEAVTAFKPLIGHADYARDVKYTESMVMTDWQPPSWTLNIPNEAWAIVREKHRILIDSEDAVPPPLERFEDMKLPKWLIAALASRGIKSPSPIQVQGLPCALSGRDMIGIAYTGSGKTLVFALPLFLYALAEETKLRLLSRSGPLGVIVCPSRELAEQSHQIICGWAEAGVKVCVVLFCSSLIIIYHFFFV
jgi:ATP-dependent RNA helicase DDX41